MVRATRHHPTCSLSPPNMPPVSGILCAGRKKRLEKRLAAGGPATFAVPLTMSFAAGLRY